LESYFREDNGDDNSTWFKNDMREAVSPLLFFRLLKECWNDEIIDITDSNFLGFTELKILLYV